MLSLEGKQAWLGFPNPPAPLFPEVCLVLQLKAPRGGLRCPSDVPRSSTSSCPSRGLFFSSCPSPLPEPVQQAGALASEAPLARALASTPHPAPPRGRTGNPARTSAWKRAKKVCLDFPRGGIGRLGVVVWREPAGINHFRSSAKPGFYYFSSFFPASRGENVGAERERKVFKEENRFPFKGPGVGWGGEVVIILYG